MKDFFDGLLDTDKFEKVVSRVEGKNHTLFITKMAKIDTLFMTKNGWKTIAFEAAHTYIAHIREYPPGNKVSLMRGYDHDFDLVYVI